MTTGTESVAIHPGVYVRSQAIDPRGITVTEAAKLLGVSRPNLSRFLNGRSAASPKMAALIESAFGIPARQILEMQAAHDGERPIDDDTTSPTPYVPPFLRVEANDIQEWGASKIAARTRFAVMLRTLIHSTGVGLERVDFPGNDDAERPGWDGVVDASRATQWIPSGRSGWEFGTNVNVKAKADGDYEKSLDAIGPKERQEITFIFVTTRRWKSKSDWVADKRAANEWRDVRVYDASDIEQWMEQSAAGQIWFCEETNRETRGVRSLNGCWSDWANVTTPKLTGDLFETALGSGAGEIAKRLQTESREPTIVAADSAEEALAFVARCFEASEEESLTTIRDRTFVFDEPGPLSRLAQGTHDFVAITSSDEVERERARLDTPPRAILISRRNAVTSEPHVVTEPLGLDAMRSALASMDIDRDRAERLYTESGGSLTVLRRRLASSPSIKTPLWSSETTITEDLVPVALSGAWNASTEADQTILSWLAGQDDYEEIETALQRHVLLDDSPVWSEGSMRGAVSRVDLLFSVAKSITAIHLKRFFDVARLVLSEDDPKLDLPRNERWLANIRGKTREISSALRSGIAETLVLLAVHGDSLLGAKTGVRCADAASLLVKDVMTPLTTRVLEANKDDLRVYAEAAPEVFLKIIEEDLQSDSPEVHGLLENPESPFFGECTRAGLLWALEGLAWNTNTMLPVALILAQLAEVEIKDNWSNTPMRSLQAIFCTWMPQTEADNSQRVQALKMITRRYPKIGWSICLSQLKSASNIGQYSHKPRFRPDGRGFGEPFKTWGPVMEFVRAEVEIALSWPKHDAHSLCELVDCLPNLGLEYQDEVWMLINDWVEGGADDESKANVREKIRVGVLSRRAARRANEDGYARLRAAATAVLAALEPSDPILRDEWLFREQWLAESASEAVDPDLDLRGRDERIADQRSEVLDEIHSAQGISGVLDLAARGDCKHEIGRLLATRVLDHDATIDLLRSRVSLHSDGENEDDDALARGTLWGLKSTEDLSTALHELEGELSPNDFVRLLRLSPFGPETWGTVDSLAVDDRAEYWSSVNAHRGVFEAEAMNKAVSCLIDVGRPRAAFCCAQYDLGSLSHSLLVQLLDEMRKVPASELDHYTPDSHHIKTAFSHLNDHEEIPLEKKAELELAYLEILSEPWRDDDGGGIPNLERHIEENPEMFVRAVSWAYKRKSGGVDPESWAIPDEYRDLRARQGYHLLEGLRRIPGRDGAGELRAERLREWIDSVVEIARGLDREGITLECIGRILAHAPPDEEGVWPCEPVREVLEDLRSEAVVIGANRGVYNSRGAVWRGEGGSQERELAAQYRQWSESLKYSFPFVASRLLGEIAAGYEREARTWDEDASIQKRLRD